MVDYILCIHRHICSFAKIQTLIVDAESINADLPFGYMDLDQGMFHKELENPER